MTSKIEPLTEFEAGLSVHLRDGPAVGKVDIDVQRDASQRAWEAIVTWRCAGQTIETIQWPADWWQAFKSRWFPRWFLRRWPATNKVVVIRALYPRISLPHEEHFLSIGESLAPDKGDNLEK